MEQFQITSRPRHLRYVFFVDENFPYATLLALMNLNQNLWGGRYNPIVPVKDNTISDRWKEILKFYDPDYIYYTKEIDPEVIKQLRIFNPCAYYNFDEKPQEPILGVTGFYLLSQFHSKSRIILTSGTWNLKSPLLSYYRTNFGFDTSLNHHEVELTKDFDRKIVTDQEFNSLNKFISELRPINQSHLSRRNLNTSILRSENYTGNFHFELVIAKDKSSNADLFYFWNRMLFELRNIFYVTLEELNLLCEDASFGQILSEMDSDNSILVISQTLTKEEIQDIIDNKLKKVKSSKHFENGRDDIFPFKVNDNLGLFERNYGEVSTVQVLHSRKGLLHLPKLGFTNKVSFFPQSWAIDILLKKIGDNQNEITFPLTTDAQFIVRRKGRINQKRNISIIQYNDENSSDNAEIDIPEFKYLLSLLTRKPFINGERIETKYIRSGLHDDSNKLAAFLKTFDYHFSSIDDFFTDKFWVTIFEELSLSAKATGSSISFEEILKKCKPLLASEGIVELDENKNLIGKKGETWKNEENLVLGLKGTLEELCTYSVFLKGFNFKCVHCSSQYWYHLNEVNERVNCKGCFEDFEIPIEPKFAYKLNDLIKNNIFRPDGNRDGNLTVIRTLVRLNERSRQSFQYSPQLNFYDSYHHNKSCAEIDIACMSEGQLIIGEAKHKSKAFSDHGNKSLHSLVDVAKTIRPDKIVLSCYEDSHNRLENAKKNLLHFFNGWEYTPEIETLLLRSPDYSQLEHQRYFFY